MTKISINSKVTRILVLAIAIIMLILLLVNLAGVWKMRFDTIGQRQKQDAQIFSNFIAQQIVDNVNKARVHVKSPWWIDAVKKANLRYASWKPEAIKEYMARMDEQWITAAVDSQFIQGCLSSPMSQRLKALMEEDISIAKILLMDKYGGLVAASGKTSDFYQADEIWWQRAYNNGKGEIFFGGIKLDELSGKISSVIAIPIQDETGQIIGVSKIYLDLSVLFESLSKYEFGKTGHVSLLDMQGNVIYHRGLKPMSNSGFSGFVLERILRNKKGFETIVAPCLKVKSIVAVAKVNIPFFEANGINWAVVVSQAENEVFSPIYIIFVEESVLTIIILILTIFIMQKIMLMMFIAPLEKIKEGVARFAGGDLDYRIDIKTADEFELLAEFLNEMSARLKQTMVTRDRLEESIKELSKSQNILISMLDDNNQVRGRLEERIAELKRAQNMLLQSEKLASLGRLAADIAHEVNNPLMIISGNAQLSLMNESVNAEVKNNLQIIMEESQKAKSIMHRLLKFAKPSKDEIKKVNINESLESTVSVLEKQFQLENIEIKREYGDNLAVIPIDEQLMQEVFTNLMNNAKEAMPSGGTITIKTSLDGDYLRIDFKDTGLGMPEEIKKRLFEPFFTSKEQGTGLGLSICFGIVKAHNGELNIESKLNQGTIATIMLPWGGNNLI